MDVRLPQLGMALKKATIVAWLKAVGDAVALGEPIAQVETDKAVGEFESPAAGVLARIVAPAGATVKVGALLCVIE
ncbi:MAG: lipoyl domain-containing protein [Chloroflexota bacterium]